MVTLITEYLKRILRYPSQNLDNPSVFVFASTGEAATNFNGVTLDSVFNLPVKSGLKLCGYRSQVTKNFKAKKQIPVFEGFDN